MSKNYKTVVRHTMLHSDETWVLRKKEDKLIMRTEMRMIKAHSKSETKIWHWAVV